MGSPADTKGHSIPTVSGNDHHSIDAVRTRSVRSDRIGIQNHHGDFPLRARLIAGVMWPETNHPFPKRFASFCAQHSCGRGITESTNLNLTIWIGEQVQVPGRMVIRSSAACDDDETGPGRLVKQRSWTFRSRPPADGGEKQRWYQASAADGARIPVMGSLRVSEVQLGMFPKPCVFSEFRHQSPPTSSAIDTHGVTFVQSCSIALATILRCTSAEPPAMVRMRLLRKLGMSGR